MQLSVISVANKPPAWVAQGVNEYQKRMKQWPLHFIDIPIASRKKFNEVVDKIKLDEAQRLEKAIASVSNNAIRIALDVTGSNVSTEQLANKLNDFAFAGQDVVLLIGGPDGLDASIKNTCDWRWSLSNLTFPHPLVKILLAEQLYRAWSVTINHPYHRGG